MTRAEYAVKIENDFEAYFQKTIDDVKLGNPQLGDYTYTTIVNMADDLLQGEINRRNKNFNKDNLIGIQAKKYDEALIHQIHYILTQGDFSLFSGYDVTTNAIIDTKEFDKRILSPRSLRILINAGIMYRGFGGSRADDDWYFRRYL